MAAQTTKKKPFERSKETQRIIDCLRQFDKGHELTYMELSRLVDMPLDSNTPKLISARQILQREHNAVWVAVAPRIGMRRLNDTEIAERLPQWWLKGARSKLNRGDDQADVVDLGQLDISTQSRFAVDAIQLHLAQDALSKATRRKMEKVSRGTSNDLPSFTAVEWAISLSPKGRSK